MVASVSLKKRLLFLFAFYMVFGIMYWVANSLQTSFEYNFWKEAIVDYTLKALLTLPVWWFVFKVLHNVKPVVRFSFHLLLCPLYVVAWFTLYRVAARALGLDYLQGYGAVWDVYIPMLFYCIQFGLFHAYEYWSNYQKQMLKEQEIKETARVAEINSYKAQLQPHFLFNTLNSINATLTHEHETARELIAKLADNFRYVIKTGDTEYVPLKDEIEFIQNCLELEQIRFNDRLKVAYDVDASLLHHNIPPMILQPLVENAIKHGIARSISGGEITIAVHEQAGKMAFVIANTCEPGATPAPVTTGIGISNIKKRLEMLYGEPLFLEIGATGAKVSFKIPL